CARLRYYFSGSVGANSFDVW
nr:immunoglobulin heavy chain junction region [Macaca mulatta]MOW32883.1 immunoglobulin heavy chain junction region [Macaca mulatta]